MSVKTNTPSEVYLALMEQEPDIITDYEGVGTMAGLYKIELYRGGTMLMSFIMDGAGHIEVMATLDESGKVFHKEEL